MSEQDTPATAPAAETPAASTTERGKQATSKKDGDAEKPKAKPKVTLPSAPPKAAIAAGVVLAAFLAGGGAGYVLLGPRVVAARASMLAHPKKGTKKGKKGGHETEKPSAFRLENLIVNPAGSQGTRFLMTTVSVQSTDEKLIKALEDHEDEARDVVIATLEAHTMEALMQSGARDSVKAHLTRALTPLAMHGYEPGDRSDEDGPLFSVYLPQFVIQ